MVELRVLGGDADQAQMHLVFVHGLDGGLETTWQVSGKNGTELWPCWLVDDLSGAAVWGIGYDAASSGWRGNALPLEDRARNIWRLIRSEPLLGRGEIVFIGHSMGGLVIAQLLRCLDGDREERDAEAFTARTRRIVFLGTPHRGSWLASLMSRMLLMFPTAAIKDLRAGTAQQRDLSSWFRKRVKHDEIATLQFAEGKQLRWGIMSVPKIVSPESADAGLLDTPTVVDETHTSICKPTDRQAQVYKGILAFLQAPVAGRSAATRLTDAVTTIDGNVDAARIEAAEYHRDLQVRLDDLKTSPRLRPLQNTGPLDDLAMRELGRLRQRRFFREANAAAEACALVGDVEQGYLMLAGTAVRQEVIAWCARILAPTETEEARALLARHPDLEGEAVDIARFRVRVADGELDEALGDIARYNTPASRGAAYIAIQHERGFDAASAWMEAARLQLTDLDDGAVVVRIGGALEEGKGSLARDLARQVTIDLLERCAAANQLAGDAYLSGAISEVPWSEARRTALVALDSVPLKDDRESLALRGQASACYARLARMTKELSLRETALQAADWHLWLELNDPNADIGARRRLEDSLADPGLLLRRFLWARQCGIGVDLIEVEREIDRQVALSGGTRFEHAVARYAMALAQNDAATGAAYLDRHWEGILRHLNPELLIALQAEMLARAGKAARARDRLAELEEIGVGPKLFARLSALIDEAEGRDVTATLRTNYQHSGGIADLRALVETHAMRGDHDEAVKYGRMLVGRTGHRDDVRRLAGTLHAAGSPREAIDLLADYPALDGDPPMRLLRARSLFDTGQLTAAESMLGTLRGEAASPEARFLHLQLKITSGDWDALQAFVEEQWSQRAERTPYELLQAGQIAHSIGVARGEALVREAARNASGDAVVLAAAYHAAVTAGWEDDEEVARWVHRAADLSEAMENGPMQRVSLDHLLERQPEWEAHRTRMTEMAIRGEAPLFGVAQSLNQPLTRLVLLEALANREQPDVRRRSLIFATSGARNMSPGQPRSVGIDPIALLTAALLGVLDAYQKGFDVIWIAHETLGWLFEEQAQLRFHQPSQVIAAQEMQRLAADGTVRVHEATAAAPEALVREVGRTLAHLLTAAETVHDDGRQRLVVVAGPIWKVESAMTAEADLGAHRRNVCTAREVVDELIRRGALTAREGERARRRPEFQSVLNPSHSPFEDGALLLLDDAATSILQGADLIRAAVTAGFTVVVSPSRLDEARLLIEHDARAEQALAIVEELRGWLQAGIEAGWVRLGDAARPAEQGDRRRWLSHPSTTLLSLTENVDAYVVDDRFVNRHTHLGTSDGGRPLLTSWNVLDILNERDVIDAQSRLEARTTLRRAGYALAPLGADELAGFLKASQVVDGRVVEIAELRAVRESIERLRMSDALQLPTEAMWFEGVGGAFLQVLRSIWADGIAEDRARACSDWLFEFGDPRGWAHRLAPEGNAADGPYRRWVLMLLMLSVGETKDVALAYGRWIEDTVLLRLQEEEPGLFDTLIEDAKAWIEAVASRSRLEELTDGE